MHLVTIPMISYVIRSHGLMVNIPETFPPLPQDFLVYIQHISSFTQSKQRQIYLII